MDYNHFKVCVVLTHGLMKFAGPFGILTLFRTLHKNPVNGPVGYFWTPDRFMCAESSTVIQPPGFWG